MFPFIETSIASTIAPTAPTIKSLPRSLVPYRVSGSLTQQLSRRMAQAGSVAGGFLESEAQLAWLKIRAGMKTLFFFGSSSASQTRLPSYPVNCIAHRSVRTRLPHPAHALARTKTIQAQESGRERAGPQPRQYLAHCSCYELL